MKDRNMVLIVTQSKDKSRQCEYLDAAFTVGINVSFHSNEAV